MSRPRRQGDIAGWVRCPKAITGRQWVKLWSDSQSQLRHQGTWRLTDAGDLERFVLARKAAAVAQARIDEDGEVVKGSKGQPRAHPLYGVVIAQTDLSLRIAKALRLTAEARTGSGLDQPASEPDIDDDQYGGMA